MQQEKLDYVLNVSSDFAKEYEASKNNNVKDVSAMYFVAKLEEGVTLEEIVTFSDKKFRYNFKKPMHDNYNKLYINCEQTSPNEAYVEMVHSKGHDSYNEWDEGEFYDNRKANIDLKVENGYLIGRASLDENVYSHMLANEVKYSFYKDIPAKKFKEEFLDVYLDALRINLLTKGEKEFITKNPDKVQAFGKENGVKLSAEYEIAKVFEYHPVPKLEFEILFTKGTSKETAEDALVKFANDNNFRYYDGTQVRGFSFGESCRDKTTGESFNVYKYKSVSGHFGEKNMMNLLDSLHEKDITYTVKLLSAEKGINDCIRDIVYNKIYDYEENMSKNVSKLKENNVKLKNGNLKPKFTKVDLENNGNSL